LRRCNRGRKNLGGRSEHAVLMVNAHEDIRTTQAPSMQVVANDLPVEMQSIPPAPTQPPQLSTLDCTSTHSYESSKPGIAHFMYGKSQSTLRRIRRAPDAAIVLAVTAWFNIRSMKQHQRRQKLTTGPIYGLVTRPNAISVARGTLRDGLGTGG
jgi:hypothetical protein